MRDKKGALELSIGTVVVIVFAMIMLILGIVFIRNIMCGAISMTGDINNKVRGEINNLFQTTAGEVVCIGSEGEPVAMIPGKINIIYCAVKAPVAASYTFELEEMSGSVSGDNVLRWISGDTSWSGSVAPGDEIPKKILRVNIPKEAPEELITFQMNIKKDGTLISTQDLDFQITRTGWFKSTVC